MAKTPFVGWNRAPRRKRDAKRAAIGRRSAAVAGMAVQAKRVRAIPLGLYFVASMLWLASSAQLTAAQWPEFAAAGAVTILFVIALFAHAVVGLRIGALDYVTRAGLCSLPRCWCSAQHIVAGASMLAVLSFSSLARRRPCQTAIHNRSSFDVIVMARVEPACARRRAWLQRASKPSCITKVLKKRRKKGKNRDVE